MTDEVMHAEKYTPAPVTFVPKDFMKKKRKLLGNYRQEEKRVHFTDNQKWLNSFNSAKLSCPKKDYNPNFKHVKPRLKSANFASRNDEKPTSTWIIPKEDAPGPGSYNTSEAIVKQQWGQIKGQFKQGDFPLSFIKQRIKQFEHVPGSGHYKTLEAAEKKASQDKRYVYQRH